nr:PREDICTED: solute carrier family 23 member 2-like isoform X2 [Lepisosteus oculatus]
MHSPQIQGEEIVMRNIGMINTAFESADQNFQPETIVIGETSTENEETFENQPTVDLIYTINDRPPWYLCALLGFQHYILAFGGIIAIPLILAEPMCIGDNNAAKSQLISTIFFVSGLSTLLQTTFGTRLPILQGGTFSFVTPTLAILALPKWRCPDMNEGFVNKTNASQIHGDEIWKSRLREIQGAILIVSLLQVLLGVSGLIGFLVRFIGPLAIAPTINLIGLSLFIEAGKKSGGHWGIAALTVSLILLFSQYLSNVNVPIFAYTERKWKIIRYPLFKLFSVLFGMCGSWVICFLLTYFDALPSKLGDYGYTARTDINLDAVRSAPWFHVPYPGQWGVPTVTLASVLGMMAGVLASSIESIGDYYACARLSGAPPPPTHAINRGIAIEGIGCILAAIWGTGNATTSYSQNIAALGITKYVDLNSSRNLLILGFSTFSGLVLPTWFNSNPEIIDTGIEELDQVIMVLFTTHMFIGGFFGFILDNTIPGTEKERGIKAWREQIYQNSGGGRKDLSCYDIPFCNECLHKLKCALHIPFLQTYRTAEQRTRN